MSYRVVSVGSPASLRLADHAAVIIKNHQEAGRIPLEDMAALVLDGSEITLSHTLLAACADHGVMVITSDERHLPNAVLLPLAGHTLHTAVLRDQLAATAPNQKRTWQTIVRAKIRAQARLAELMGHSADHLRRLAVMVRSGDPDNVEATAAARYFETVFGATFIRDRDQPGLNALLNYGYAVVRAAVARAVVGAGLHPALGIHHHGQYNPLCLADDAMEPLRPAVDRVALQIAFQGELSDSLRPADKRTMLEVLGQFVAWDGHRFPLIVGLERYAASLRRAICEGESLTVPQPLFEP